MPLIDGPARKHRVNPIAHKKHRLPKRTKATHRPRTSTPAPIRDADRKTPRPVARPRVGHASDPVAQTRAARLIINKRKAAEKAARAATKAARKRTQQTTWQEPDRDTPEWQIARLANRWGATVRVKPAA